MVPVEKPRLSALLRPTAAQTSCRCGSARLCPTSVSSFHLRQGSSLLCVEAQALACKVHTGAPLASSSGASPQQEDAASGISFNLGLSLLLYSFATIIDLDQFTVSRAPKDTSHVGQETDISFSPVSLWLQLFAFTKCWSSACVDGRLFCTLPPTGQCVQYRASQPPVGTCLWCPPRLVDHHPCCVTIAKTLPPFRLLT